MQMIKIETNDMELISNFIPGRVRQIVERATDTNDKLLDICKLLKDNIPHYDWVGFYLVKTKGKLSLGPFVGEPTEHVEIPFGKGVCGQAAETKMTLIVDDVTKEEKYLSCSPGVRSEIVIPILKNGEVIGELDIDSHAFATFTEEHRKLLEYVCESVSMLF